MMNSFNTFPQDNSELIGRVVAMSDTAEPTTIKNAISAANKLLEEAKARAADIIETAKAEASGEIELAKQRGFQDGVASALKMFSQLHEKRERVLKEAQEEAFNVALEAAKQITGEIIKQDYQQIIAGRIKQALSLFALQDTVKIKLNNVDYKMFLEKFNELALEHEQTINWQPTDSMPVGAFEISVDGCKLESNIEKQLDCVIAERLSING